MTNNIKHITNKELLKELAKRIVSNQLKLDKPQNWIIKDKTPEQIVKDLKDRMGLCNQDGFALTNISEIYDEESNGNPLNLNYFIVEFKEFIKNKEKENRIPNEYDE